MDKIQTLLPGDKKEADQQAELLVEALAFENLERGDQVGFYLSQVGQVPLLTKDEEIGLAKKIEIGREAANILAKAVGSERQRSEYARLVEEGQAAREHLILANSRLVISVAKRYRKMGLPFQDLIQEGHVGLMRAIKKFDYRRGYKFSTYATWWIRQAVTRVLADHGRTIRLPVHMGDRVNRLRRIVHQLTQQLDRQPFIDEIARELGAEVEEIEELLIIAQYPLSLEQPIEFEDDAELGEFLVDPEAESPETSTIDSRMRADLGELLESLPHREARVIRLRFGLDGGSSQSLSEIGQRLGVTRERARQLEGQAMKRLRNPSLSHRLKSYLQS